MVQNTQNKWFDVQGFTYGNNVIPECGSVVNGTPSSATTQCVSIAQALDNSVYTVVLKNAAGASLNGSGYTLTLPKQPYVSSTLSAAMFPAFTSITIDGQALTPSTVLANKSVAVNWTMPAGIVSRHLNIWANTSTGASYFQVNKNLLPTATSALLGLGTPLTTGTLTNAGVWLEGVDTFGRKLAVSKSVTLQSQPSPTILK